MIQTCRKIATSSLVRRIRIGDHQNQTRGVTIAASSSPQRIVIELKNIENIDTVAKQFFEFKEIAKDSFSPTVLACSRQGYPFSAYGGLVFAQAIAAAENTVDQKLKPHSAHCYFIMNTDTKEPVSYNVKRVRDGKSFATRTVEVIQKGKVTVILQASFHTNEKESAIHQKTMPKVPPPESLMNMQEAVPFMKEMVEKGSIPPMPEMMHRLSYYDHNTYVLGDDLFEIRPTNLGDFYGFSSNKKPHLYFWMKARGKLSNDEKLHRWLIAYMSDSKIIPTATSAHYSNDLSPSMMFSLDHSIFLHRSEVRTDDWLLFESESEIAGGSRAYVNAKIWGREGALLASCHQEVLIRTRDQTSII